MKKTLKFMGLCALAVLALAGCKKEQNAVTLRGTLTQPTSNAKTHIGNNDSLVWNEGDAIKVYTADKANSALCTTTDNNKPVADFTITEGTLPGTGSFLAFYPATAVEETENGFKLPLSATQTYVENNFATNTYPMYAASDDKNFSFQSPYALLAIPIMGSGTTVGSIELTSNTPGQKLSGYYEVSTAGTCGTTLLGDGAETITLNCPGGLVLGTTAKTVCFVVPAGVFASGFKAVLKNTTGGELYTLAASGNNLTAAQTILLMNPVSISSITVITGTAEPDPTDPTKYILHGSYSAPQGTSVDEVGFYYGEGATLTQQSVTPTGNNFSLTITVAPGQMITYKAYAKNGMNEIVDETGESSFIVFAAPTVTTGTAAATSATAATGHVTLTNAGTTALTDIELGICWGTSPNPEVSSITNNHASVSGTLTVGTEYTVDMTGLTATTPYYVRGYAKIGGVYYYDETAGGMVSFTTPAAFVAPTVTTGTAAATSATAATGNVTLTNAGTTALTDIELGICWGTTANPEVSTTTNNHASVSGTLAVGTEYAVDMTGLTATTPYYVRGYAKIGGVYYYDETAGGTVSFTTPAALPTGAIDGKFSVSATQQVYFSQGNMQYQASTNTWRFAEHQWNYVGTQTPDYWGNSGGNVSGSDNKNISSTYSGWIDLFGKGTSGWNGTGASCYQPWSSALETYFNGNLTGAYAEADWAWHNPISNGGNQVHQWRTLSYDEWDYLLNTRDGASSKMGLSIVNGVKGLILLPDNWVLPSGLTFNPTITDWVNVYSLTQWDAMEDNGAVFLPSAGCRDETTVKYAGKTGMYSSTSNSSWGFDRCSYLDIEKNYVTATPGGQVYLGYSVRPVQDAN